MRNMARWVAGIVLVLAVAWGGTWWYAQQRLRDMLVSYAAGHTTADGSSTLTYDNITTGHDPLAASATLHDLRWNLQMPGSAAPLIISEAQLRLSLSAFNPNILNIGLPRRLDIAFPEGTINISFGGIAARAGVDPLALFNRNAYPLTSQTVQMRDVAISADSSFQVLTIGHLAMRESWRNAAGPDQTALALKDRLENLAIPSWVAAKWNVPFGGRLSNAALDITLSGPASWASFMQHLYTTPQNTYAKRKLLMATLHDWAQKGGKANASLQLAIGPSTLNATADVAFDNKAQPNGTAAVTVDHLDSFVAALTTAYPQLQQSIGTIEGKYSSYLTTSATDGQVLTLHVAYGQNGILLNGTKVEDLPPLDWTALENGPAASAQAPGDGSGAASP